MSCVWQDLKINIYLIVNLAVFGLVSKKSAKIIKINLSLFFACLCGRVEVLLESYLFQAKQTEFMVDKNALPLYGLTHWGSLSLSLHKPLSRSEIQISWLLSICVNNLLTLVNPESFYWCLMYMVNHKHIWWTRHYWSISVELKLIYLLYTEWKVSKYRVFSGPYFPTFGLNTRDTKSECGKIRTRRNSIFGHISCSVSYYYWINK